MPALKDTFTKYKNRIFVETGSHLGDGIQVALDSNSFESIISIELGDRYYEYCVQRFRNLEKVKLLKGDSYKVLPEILEKIDEPVTFWLDGHNSGGDTAWGDYHTPLLHELDAIKRHHIKTHTILVDDMRCWKNFNPTIGFVQDDIYTRLREINPDYKFQFEDGQGGKDDILVALV